ncbi:hypothetical protein [Natrinema sp. HArc-T2]|uniref:DUF7344 domain-containing protein n=1 Tax=Natrinema sp. HArc-T2 TaxID=3242701 RepID=UPI00359D529D
MRETNGEVTALMADATPSLDVVFDLLSNSRRRYALYYLNDQPDGVATLEALTENVIGFEQQTGARDGEHTTDRHASVQMELTHTHLPKLEDAGILEHDQRSETVRYWRQPSLEEWLEHAYHKEIT